jgi:hypothetical protein
MGGTLTSLHEQHRHPSSYFKKVFYTRKGETNAGPFWVTYVSESFICLDFQVSYHRRASCLDGGKKKPAIENYLVAGL